MASKQSFLKLAGQYIIEESTCYNVNKLEFIQLNDYSDKTWEIG